MDDSSAYLSGEIMDWPSKDEMAKILRSAGLSVYVGRYSVRVENCSHFVFQEYGGDLGDPCIDADGDSAESLRLEAKLVSDALSNRKIKHRFSIYDCEDHLTHYLHFNWPLEEDCN